MKKATHQGECQLCSKIQKLPNESLSLHGYTVKWSMFEGTCPGSKELPYEKSCELIKEQIPRIEAQIIKLKETAQRLRLPATTNKAWYKLSVVNCVGDKKSKWVEVEIIEEQCSNSDGSYNWVEYVAVYKDQYNDKKEKLKMMSLTSKTILDVATELNQRYSDGFDSKIKSTEEYLKWCKERVNNWKPVELNLVS